MSIIPVKLKREEKIREYINQFLGNIGQDRREEWWNDPGAARALARLAESGQPQLTDSAELAIDCDGVLVAASWGGGTDPKALDQLVSDIRSRAERAAAAKAAEAKAAGTSLKGQTAHFLFFTGDLKSRTALEMRLDRGKKRELSNALCKSAGASLQCRYTFVIDREYQGELARIQGVNRYDSIPMPPFSGRPNTDSGDALSGKKRDPLCSIVLTAPLRQLVELYNLTGDPLFRRNVRLGIGEEMDVHRAMYDTLEKEPEHFWYMNNGITLLVDDPDFRLRSADSLELGALKFDAEPRFSVINGAQTISICSKYAFEWEYRRENGTEEEKQEARKRLASFEKAQVILRVIHVPLHPERAGSPEEQENIRLANRISIALNRQKPVKPEDIAFTTPFVQRTLDYLEHTPDAPFRLVRRGETGGPGIPLDLVDFSKARLACAGQPGKARTVSSGAVMRLEPGSDRFCSDDIFKPEWLEDGPDRDQVFRRFYGAVLFASQLEDCYKKNQNAAQKQLEKEGRGESALAAASNGSWYFTALAVQLLNGFSDDYTDFTLAVSDVAAAVPQAIPYFAAMAEFCADSGQTLNSNNFKKDELYRDMLNELKEAGSAAPPFQEFARLLAPAAGMDPGKKRNQAQIAYGPAFFCKDPPVLPSSADAFARIVTDVLTTFTPDPAGLAEFSHWLTSDPLKCLSSHSFTKTPPQVDCGGTTYYIGTSINNKLKFKYLDRLCELAAVPREQITWKRDGRDVYHW